MRLVPLEHLKEETKVAIDIINKDGVPLVRAGEKLSAKNLSKLDKLNHAQVYIYDEYCVHDEPPHYSTSRIGQFYNIIKKMQVLGESVATSKSGRAEVAELKRVSAKIVDELEKISLREDLRIMYEPVKIKLNTVVEESIYIAIMSVVLGMKLKLRQAQLVELCVTALAKNFPLTRESIMYEKEVYSGDRLVEMNPILSHIFVSRHQDFSINVVEGVLHQRELCDGSGYPYGLKGDEIHLYARITGVIDFFYKLKTENDPLVVRHGILEVVFNSKLRQFDQEVSKAFLEIVELFTLDTMVHLTTGDVAIVLKNNYGTPFRPVVKIIKTMAFPVTTTIDLTQEEYSSIKITSICYYLD